MTLEELLTNAILEARSRLVGFGIEDDEWQVKVKRFPPKRQHNTLALYRARSQFRSRLIFWVNEGFLRICVQECADPAQQLVLSLLHEYGHVIHEFAMLRVPGLYDTIRAISDDEEDFAETFAVVCSHGAASPAYRQIAAHYMAALRGE